MAEIGIPFGPCRSHCFDRELPANADQDLPCAQLSDDKNTRVLAGCAEGYTAPS